MRETERAFLDLKEHSTLPNVYVDSLDVQIPAANVDWNPNNPNPTVGKIIVGVKGTPLAAFETETWYSYDSISVTIICTI